MVTAQDCAGALAELRQRVPLVQCLTNIVVAQWTANVLLAVGAAPAMVDNEHEAAEFAAVAGGVLVNLGTPYADTSVAMAAAATAATSAGRPWVLDPVAAGALSWRTRLAHELLEVGPSVVRGNASEILALTGGAGGRGVESTDPTEAAADAAVKLAEQHGCVVAVSGPVDHLTDGGRTVLIANGHPWLTRVTGVGCALGALMAAFSAVTDDRLVAAAAATATLTVAAEPAAAASAGTGSFAVALLDRLTTITPAELAAGVRLR
ncbi:MAG TPA: hydroxyethylthiazole kinase [Dermatophilaceae bacterium]|nr:hydroxyethylthiazole kinase [Dermatophilaceae bacterium]